MTSDYLKKLGAKGHLKVKDALRKWDPIGVYGPANTWPDDEYDSYSDSVVGYLDRGAPKEEIVRYLETLCAERIEMPFDRARAESVIDELLSFWPKWRSELKEFRTHDSRKSLKDYLAE